MRARQPISYPPASFGPSSINLVGVESPKPGVTEPAGIWFENFKNGTTEPADLHEAQRRKRIAP
jgi:hypothetical protein